MLYIYLNANWVKVLKLHRFLKTTLGLMEKKKTIKTPINPNILVSRDHFELSTTPLPPGDKDHIIFCLNPDNILTNDLLELLGNSTQKIRSDFDPRIVL